MEHWYLQPSPSMAIEGFLLPGYIGTDTVEGIAGQYASHSRQGLARGCETVHLQALPYWTTYLEHQHERSMPGKKKLLLFLRSASITNSKSDETHSMRAVSLPLVCLLFTCAIPFDKRFPMNTFNAVSLDAMSQYYGVGSYQPLENTTKAPNDSQFA